MKASRPNPLFSILVFSLFVRVGFSEQPPKSYLFELARKGKIDSAYILTKSLAQAQKSDDTVRYLLGKLELDGKKSDEHFRQLISDFLSSPFLAEAHYRLAQSYFARGNYGMAIHYFRLCIKGYPHSDWSEPSHYWMGIACLRYGPQNSSYFDTASVYLDHLIEQKDTSDIFYGLAWEARAQIANAQNNSELAQRALQKAKKFSTASHQPHLKFLNIEMQKDPKNTNKFLDQFMEEYPNSLEAGFFRRKFPKKFANYSPGYAYTVQLGAFASKEAAENFANKMQAKNLEVSIKQRKREPPYSVLSGQFQEKQKAENYCREELSAKKIPCFVLKK